MPISRRSSTIATAPWFVLGIEMVQGPEGLVEAMRRRQMLVQIAEMVLAKRSRHVAEAF